jgi:hypothetical protein
MMLDYPYLRTKTGVHLDFKLRNHSPKNTRSYNKKINELHLFPSITNGRYDNETD